MSAKTLLVALLLVINAEKSIQRPGAEQNLPQFMAFARGINCPSAIANALANGKLSVTQLNTDVMSKLKKYAMDTSVAIGAFTNITFPDSTTDSGKVQATAQQFDDRHETVRKTREAFICYLAETDTRIRNNNLKVEGAGKGQNLPSWVDDQFNENNCTNLLNVFGHMMEERPHNPDMNQLLKTVKSAFNTDVVCSKEMVEDFAAALGKTEMGAMTSAQIRDLLSKVGRKFWSLSDATGLDARMKFFIQMWKQRQV